MARQFQESELRDWRSEAERLSASKNLLYFRQQVGLGFDKKRLSTLEKEAVKHYGVFIKRFGRQPEVLFNLCAFEIGFSKTYRLYLKLSDLRTTKMVDRRHKVNGVPVNWGSWRQFAAGTDDSKARKGVFDTFLGKSPILAPAIRARFDGFARSMSELGTDVLSNYLMTEGIEYQRLISFVDNLGNNLRSAFRESLKRYSKEILGRDAKYYDDFYFFRSRVFRKYAESFLPRVDPVSRVVRTMAEMGLDARKVKVDSVDRKGKSASAFCFGIRVPTDVRISYRKSNPLENFTGIFHEMGHGVHFSSVARDRLFEDKYGVPMGVAEIFSIFFENLMHDKDYLEHKLGLPEAVASDLVERFMFNDHFFVTFYSANSLMKLRYWHDGLSIDEATRLYVELTAKYMGIKYPGEYWLLHHVMPDYPLYSPSYLLAAVRALELKEALTSRFGQRYWQEKGSGQFLLELMTPGRGIELGRFSKLDPGPYVKYLTGTAG
jgi:hypothetical protein